MSSYNLYGSWIGCLFETFYGANSLLGELTTGRNHWLPIAETAASKVADRKGNGFIVEKIVRKNTFYYFHCYLSILALLSIEINWGACRVDSISEGSISTPHIIRTFRQSCHLAVYKLKSKDGRQNTLFPF